MQVEDKASILVVDDNPAKRLALVSVLEQLNQNLVVAESGRDALRLLLSHEYALILLDVQMPDMDGFETAALIRSRKQSEVTPIIFVTAYSRGETDMLHGYSEGAVDYVFTPIIPEILRAKVSVFVDLYRKTQVIKRHEEDLENLVEQRTAALTAEIAERKRAEARITRLNRVYAVLSGINTTIVRVREPQELFDEACRIAVEHGKFSFAWIGTLDADTRQVTPVARAGRDDGYLDQINLTAMADTPGNCRLTAEAITQAKPVICNDIATDDRMNGWRSEALNRGYRSVAVFPLMLGARPVGVFLLYAPEADVFDEEEMRLLIEMAGDISFALDHIQKEERLNYLAYFDAITGLPNRALFHERVEQRIGAAHRDRKVFSVIMLDLERFSSINESLGRQAGTVCYASSRSG